MDENHDRCMVLDDEADDFDYSNFQAVGAERIPMKIIENLHDIWVPAHLLQKRKNSANIYLNKPAIFRTLEKPEKSFSVYDETEDQDQPENFSAAEFTQKDMLDLLNNCKSLEAGDLSGSDEVVSATGPCKSSETNYENLIKSCNSDKFISSQKESLEPKCLEKNSETLTVCDKDLNDYVKSACLKTYIQTSDDNVRNSFDDIYNSDDEFCEEDGCTVSEEVLNEKCDPLVAPLNISEASICKAENLESATVEGACCNPDFEGSLQTDSLKGSMIDYVDLKELDESGETDLVNFPIAYKRPAIEETVKKQKNQKKKKNAQKKTVLDVFTQKIDSECTYPKVDEFYESVMSREYQRVMRREYEPYEYEYPSLKNELPDLNHNKSQNSTPEVTSEFENFKETENFEEDNASASVNSRKPTSGSLEIKGVNIILENIPGNVSEKEVQDLLTMGEVRLLYSSNCGQFKIAEISMESDTDAEWIIDCFNGSTPFGAGSSTLKCYKLP